MTDIAICWLPQVPVDFRDSGIVCGEFLDNVGSARQFVAMSFSIKEIASIPITGDKYNRCNFEVQCDSCTQQTADKYQLLRKSQHKLECIIPRCTVAPCRGCHCLLQSLLCCIAVTSQIAPSIVCSVPPG